MQKLKDLAHFIIHECTERKCTRQLGAIRLNKAIWFVDVLAYHRNSAECSVTEEKYVKRQFGPVPKRILAALRALEGEGKISIIEPAHRYGVREYRSLQPPADVLTDDDKELALDVLDTALERTATHLSEMTHDSIWRAAREGEEIPLKATLAVPMDTPPPEATAWASESIVNRMFA